MKTFRIIFFLAGFAMIAYSAFAADQIKTTETYIADSNIAVSTNQSYPFTVYIGDSLLGVTSPMKSLHFTTSGVYTGSGTIEFMIDNDPATSKIFTLPNVGTTPTPFEMDYKDPSGKINPTSAGSYEYMLNMNFSPSGVTVHGLGIKMTESHRYAPPACADGVPANQKVKTTETYIADSNTSVSSANSTVAYPFTLYIGDSLTGVTAPAIKSLHFTVSGVYTGTGTMILDINGVPGSSKTFTLPDVGTTGTPFEIDYNDNSSQINPTSAGSYDYTLNSQITGSVVVYGLGIKMTESHRYAPPTCGGLPAFGDLLSAVFDSGTNDGIAYNSIMWKGTPGTGKIQFQLATANLSTGPWTFYGNSGTSCTSLDYYNTAGTDTPVQISCPASLHNNQRYYRYKIRICSATNCTDIGSTSPVVSDVVVNWAP